MAGEKTGYQPSQVREGQYRSAYDLLLDVVAFGKACLISQREVFDTGTMNNAQDYRRTSAQDSSQTQSQT